MISGETVITIIAGPVGFTRSTIIRTAKTMASAICDEIYAFPRISMMPKRIPPIIAPGIEPIPPNTAATKALIISGETVITIIAGIIIMICLTLFVNKSKAGQAMLAVSEDKGAAQLLNKLSDYFLLFLSSLFFSWDFLHLFLYIFS